MHIAAHHGSNEFKQASNYGHSVEQQCKAFLYTTFSKTSLTKDDLNNITVQFSEYDETLTLRWSRQSPHAYFFVCFLDALHDISKLDYVSNAQKPTTTTCRDYIYILPNYPLEGVGTSFEKLLNGPLDLVGKEIAFKLKIGISHISKFLNPDTVRSHLSDISTALGNLENKNTPLDFNTLIAANQTLQTIIRAHQESHR